MTERTLAPSWHDSVEAARSWHWDPAPSDAGGGTVRTAGFGYKAANQKTSEWRSIDAMTVHGEELPCACAAASEVRSGLTAQGRGHAGWMIAVGEEWKCEARLLLEASAAPHAVSGDLGYVLVLPRAISGMIAAEAADFAAAETLSYAPEQAEAAGTGLQRTFENLANQWRRETSHLSSIAQKSMHPAYQRIIGLGPQAVPLILHDLQREPDHWFWALRAIVGEDPVPAEDAGNMVKMAEAWLQLGRERGWI